LLCLLALRLGIALVSWKNLTRRLPVITLLCAGVMIHIAIICSGRSQGEILSTAYYVYFFGVAAAPLAYALVDLDKLNGSKAPAAWICTVGFIMIHAVSAHTAAEGVGAVNEKAHEYFSAVIRFVDQHKNEPGFSFAIKNAPEDVDPEFPLLEGYPDNASAAPRMQRVSRILLFRYYDEHPRYLIGPTGRIE